MLLALPKPTFSTFAISRKFVPLSHPFEHAARSHSTLPSVEALSTTTISYGALGGCFRMLSMQLARRSRPFQLTMIIERSILFRGLGHRFGVHVLTESRSIYLQIGGPFSRTIREAHIIPPASITRIKGRFHAAHPYTPRRTDTRQ